MSDEGRRVIKMETILSLLAGERDAKVSELLFFLTQRDLSGQDEAAAAPLVKAWLFSKLPGLMESKYEPSAIYDEWVAKEIKRLGADNVSLIPIPEADMAPINAIIDGLAAGRSLASEQAAKIAELQAAVKALEPLKAKNVSLDKEITALKGKIAAGDKTIAEQKAKIAEYAGKLPVDEASINDTIKEIVTKALKDAVASVPLGAPAAAGAAAGGEAVEAGAAAPAQEEADFGFGATGAGDDGFGF